MLTTLSRSAQLQSIQNSVVCKVRPEVPQPLHSALNMQRAPSSLTRFHYSGGISATLYNDFKLDLVRMLTSYHKLRALIIEGYMIGESPSVESIFRRSALPQLTHLCLFTGESFTLFTVPELAIWGEGGGWDRLEELTMHTKDYNPVFRERPLR